MTEQVSLGRDVRRGLAWSSLNNLLLRLGSLATGIVLARLLTPAQFGVYAVALTVQAIMMTLADLGLSADLIRCRDPERRAPTVATLGLVSGALLATLGVATAGPLAAALGSPRSASSIAVLSVTLLVAGLGVVPYARLQREFRQRALFAVALVDFAVGTSVTILLVLAGWGAMGLAVGRLCAQAVAVAVQFRLAGTAPRFGWERTIVGAVLFFGLPIAGANLVSWALLSVDNVVVARSTGPLLLGYYVLAFNISTWPMTAIGQVVRSVALPGFARVHGRDGGRIVAHALAVTWALGLLAGVLLATLSSPLVGLVYGRRWLPAASVLGALGIFGALRVAFDLIASYLLARGASRSVLALQVLWFVALVPAMVVGIHADGINGAAWAHVVVAAGIALPGYVWCLHRQGVRVGLLARAWWPPLAAAAPTAALAAFAASITTSDFVGLVLGGLTGTATFAILLNRWLRHQVRHLSASAHHPDPTRRPISLSIDEEPLS
jgi:PST family polysaccharide transporter